MLKQSALTRLLQIQYPIIQTPMALADSPALAAAISNQGGLGSLGGALFEPEQIRQKIREIEKSGVDIIAAQGHEAGGHRGTDLKITSMQDALIGTLVRECNLGA